ncbi:hypothetical protein AAFP30_00265 [Gordonia sp. CPCC 205515]|uniref:hypothetical protein n=1 Tax=Gordonia sp. CPCC 205515 TaxID=3140791 RepID=UPI003AF38235
MTDDPTAVDPAADDPTAHDPTAYDPAATTSTARSTTGALAVTTTPQGLPLSVRISDRALDREPAALAEEIFRLCRQSAMVAGIRLREHLIGSGVDRDVVAAMQLPTIDDLARAEHRDDHELADRTSWLRPV